MTSTSETPEPFYCANHPNTELVLVRLSPESEVDLTQFYQCPKCKLELAVALDDTSMQEN